LALEPLEDRLVPATLTWTGQESMLWSDARNWQEHTTPYATPEADHLVFPRAASRQLSFNDAGLPFTLIHSISFEDAGYTLRGGYLNLDEGIFAEAPGGTNYIESQLDISNGAMFAVIRSNNRLQMSYPITGGALVVTGPGTLILDGDNRYSGGTTVIGTKLVVNSDTALGSGPLVLGPDPSTLVSDTGVTLANPIDVHGNATIGGSRLTLTRSVQIFDGSTLTVANTSDLVSVDGTVFGGGKLIKSGAGQLTLWGANTYLGGTEIQAGTVLVENDRSLGTGALKLTGGTLAKDTRSSVTLANAFQASGGTIHNLGDLPFTFTGPGTLLPGGTLTVFNNDFDQQGFRSEVIFSGPLGGQGALKKIGLGVTTFSGTAANTYTGATTVIVGKLALDKPAGANAAIAGPLIIGNDAGSPPGAVVELEANEQIGNRVAITIRQYGLLRLNEKKETFGSLQDANNFNITAVTLSTLIVGANDLSTTFGGVISGPGSVTKIGTGTWTLTGNSTYTLGTFVEGGTLLIDGSITGPVTVEAGATLGGTGTTGPVTLGAGAAINPGGTDPGIQKVQDLAFSVGSSYVVQLNGPDPGSGYDQLDVTGTVSLNDATLDASLGFGPAPGDRFVIIQNDVTDPVTGTFAGLPQGASLWVGGAAFHVYYDGGDGNDVVLVRNVPPAVAVPGDQTAFQNVDLALGGIRVADPEDANLTVTLGVSHGTLTLGTVAGLTVGGNGTSSVSLSGSQAALNAALAGLLYLPDHNYSGPDALALTASDGLEGTSAGVAIRVKSLAEQAADLQAQVSALRAAGVLNQGQANSLLVKLNLRDNDGDIGRVQAFLNEVDALLGAGILSPAQADALRTPGNALLTGLRRR
jgi:autotransporter-associated beta strand protein